MHPTKGIRIPIPAVWAMPVEDTYLALDTSERGLEEREVIARRLRFGDNTLPRAGKLDRLTILARQFSSPLILILLAAAILTLALDEWLEAAVILLAILVNTGLGFYQEYRAEHALEELETYVKDRARVIRAGREQEIDSSLLVPGDLITLAIGARVPADARLVESNGLTADESILTGESMPVAKQTEEISEASPLAERTNMVYAGTSIIEGSGRALVCGTDSHTELGRIAQMVARESHEPTPLQKALSQLARFIAFVVTGLVIMIFLFGIYRGEAMIDMLLMAIAIAVGAIPEALPIALTVILAIGLQRLAAKKGIMRSLAAAETLGSATVVMTDKTGTLTEARMRLTGAFSLRELSAATRRNRTGLTATGKTILETAIIGTNVLIDNPHDEPSRWRLSGHPIEASIVRAGLAHKLPVRALVDSESVLTFNSTDKFSISRHKDGKFVALGAPEILLQRSRITKDTYLAAERAIYALAGEGKRLLGVATMKTKKSHHALSAADAHNLQFVGVLVFEDPLRRDAKASVQQIEALGASVVMLTGDLKGTALSVGRSLGWEISEAHILTGAELRAMSDEELLPNLRNIRIFARVTPEDKLRIGRLYQRLGDVVAMTGDGVNDAPSLKAVDIGVALGSGSDVAKATADLVLLDDSFKTIVSAIEEGRRMLANIRKTAVYLLSTSLNEVMLIGGALLAGLPLPLTALQIIWVNLFTGSLPALSYAFDELHETRRSARIGRAMIFAKEVRLFTLAIAATMSLLLFILYWSLLGYGVPVAEAQTVIYLCMGGYILTAAFSLRSLSRPIYAYNPFSNTRLNASILIASGFIVGTVAWPVTQGIFGFVTPSLRLLSVVLLWLIGVVVIVESAKALFRMSR